MGMWCRQTRRCGSEAKRSPYGSAWRFTIFVFLKQSLSLKWDWEEVTGEGGGGVSWCAVRFYSMQWHTCSSRWHCCLVVHSILLNISVSCLSPNPPPPLQAQSLSSPPPAPPPAPPSSREEDVVFQLQTYLSEPQRPESRRLRSFSSPPDPGQRFALPTSTFACCQQPPQAPPTHASPPISIQVSGASVHVSAVSSVLTSKGKRNKGRWKLQRSDLK